MSRNLALNVVLAAGSAVLLAAAVVIVWRGSPPETPRDTGSVSPSARVAELQAELQQREVELAALRADADRLRMSLDEQRTAAEPTAPQPEAEKSDRAAASAAPKPATGVAAAVDCLRTALPDKYGKLTAEEAAALTELDLRGAQITDADLALLSSLPSLQSLILRGTAVTDAGLAHLRGMTQLTALDLRGTRVTGAGIQQLSSLGLTALHLTDTKVSGQDLHWMLPMPSLQTLKLNRLDFGDGAVADLARFPAVRHLELDGTSITDIGLRQLLAQNSALQRIELRGTPVTLDAIGELRSAYPNVEFVIDDPSITAHFGR